MSIKTNRRQVLNESPWGMWVWQTESGGYVTDDAGNFMHVFVDSRNGAVNEAAKKALEDAAKAFGVAEGGKAVFWSGRRPINDEELENQRARAAAGLVPDPLDIAAIKEEEARLKREHKSR